MPTEQETELAQRRLAEIARYDKAYHDDRYRMKWWRRHILSAWLCARPRRSSYLDVGCGRGETLEVARDTGLRARGCEVVSSLCGLARELPHRCMVDHIAGAHSLPYKDGEFDWVSCNDVLEHVLADDIPDALSEICRVARHGVLLGISQKTGPMHITIRDTDWWADEIGAQVPADTSVRRVFEDLVPPIKQPYLWVAIDLPG